MGQNTEFLQLSTFITRAYLAGKIAAVAQDAACFFPVLHDAAV